MQIILVGPNSEGGTDRNNTLRAGSVFHVVELLISTSELFAPGADQPDEVEDGDRRNTEADSPDPSDARREVELRHPPTSDIRTPSRARPHPLTRPRRPLRVSARRLREPAGLKVRVRARNIRLRLQPFPKAFLHALPDPSIPAVLIQDAGILFSALFLDDLGANLS
ncbi:unnamed protein product [Darwinula stevensoni]|uniref:Uncharacterized protein n=1 Tax=Darwinula stevensoni TaxID=69355 RepID=A0A7R9ABE1_9CRUS|nr:unnamed protein product [Darwinula stevensoni]CAG0899126.1 unnamed protein product [Darwinula stevensoni]